MGVRGLWSVLTPVRKECTLTELKDKLLAVDLSGWVCQAQTTKVFFLHSSGNSILSHDYLHVYWDK